MAAGKRPPGVMLYFDKMRPIFALLSAEERGDLVLKILDYAEYGKLPAFASGDRLENLWPSVQKAIDLDAATYLEKCKQARKAVQARWNKEKGV